MRVHLRQVNFYRIVIILSRRVRTITGNMLVKFGYLIYRFAAEYTNSLDTVSHDTSEVQ